MSLLVFYLIVFIAVVLVTVAVLTHLYVVYCHFICLMSRDRILPYQGLVTDTD